MLVGAALGRVDDALLREADHGEDWDDLARRASSHGVQGWLARELRARSGVPRDFQLGLQSAALKTAGNHHHLLEEATSTLSLLETAGIEGLVLKGPAVVERYYGDPTLRPYGDVDVLVRPGELERALSCLEAAGYVLADRNWEFLVEDLRGQLHLTSPRGSVLELHWHLVNGSRQRRTLRMSPEEMWDTVETADLGGLRCLTLPVEEEIAHLSLHAAMHGCNRLIWLLDLAAVLRTVDRPDWDRVARRLRRWRFARGGGFVMTLAAGWGGAGVPEEVLRELVGGRTKLSAFRRIASRWDLGSQGGDSQARELFFATAADGLRTTSALAFDAIVPAPGQQPDPAKKRKMAGAYRVTVGTVRRVWGKIFRGRGEAPSEYVAVGDQISGKRCFLDAVAATVLRAHEHRVLVVSPSRSIGMSHYSRALVDALGRTARVDVLDAATGGGVAGLVSAWWRMKPGERRGARVLVTSPHWSVPLLLRLTGWSGGFVWHDPILDAATPLTRPLHKLYYRLLARRLPLVVLHGSVFTQHVATLGLAPRDVVVVPHGFVPDQLVADAPYDAGGPFLFVGRLHPYKGLDVLLRALSMLEAEGTRARVIVGGSGVHERLVPAGLASVEVRAGELPDEELRDLIGKCSAVLLPYERANQSGVLATAFRSGRPVIASRVGSFAEYVRDGVNGVLVPPGDPRALATAISRVSEGPEIARDLARGARATWEHELSPVRWSKEVLAALFG